LAQAIRQLPLCPVEGELRPLAHLYLPGNFEDPLNLAGLVDVAALGGRRQFLRDLGVRELDFDSYVHEQLPRALKQNLDLPSDARHQLVQLLAARLGEMRDDEALQAQLSQMPLIACLDGSFRPANEVYASREVMDLLGEGVHIAEPTESKAVAALQHWLGVRERPSGDDIVQALALRQGPHRIQFDHAYVGLPALRHGANRGVPGREENEIRQRRGRSPELVRGVTACAIDGASPCDQRSSQRWCELFTHREPERGEHPGDVALGDKVGEPTWRFLTRPVLRTAFQQSAAA
jgi:hypothetical protein